MDGWIVSWSEGQGQGELEAESRGVLSFLPSKLTTLAAQPAPASRSPSTPSDSQQKNASPFPPGGDLDAKHGLSTFIFTPRHHLQSHSTRFSSAHENKPALCGKAPWTRRRSDRGLFSQSFSLVISKLASSYTFMMLAVAPHSRHSRGG